MWQTYIHHHVFLLSLTLRKVSIVMDVQTCENDLLALKEKGLALRDAIDLLSGKWKFCIMLNLRKYGSLRFKDMLETSKPISPKILAKELQEMEDNFLIVRTVNDTRPITVSYALSEYAEEANAVLSALIAFGLNHRKMVKSSMTPIQPDLSEAVSRDVL
jgi:DNA-binding HxlR family transcriptional regulator